MSIPTLTPSYVFGINNDVNQNIAFVDDSTVIYPVGNQLIQYNIEKKTQHIMPIQLDDLEISCMTLNLTENCIAIGTKYAPGADYGKTRPYIGVFDITTGKKKKVFRTVESNATTLINNTTKGSINNNTIRQMSTNPIDAGPTQIILTGNNLFRQFRFQDGFLKLIHQSKLDNDVKCHAWYSDAIIVCGTGKGDILVYENGELASELSYAYPLIINNGVLEQPPKPSITAITAFSSGIFIGLNTGLIVYYEKINESPYFKKKKEVLIDEGEIATFAWNAKQDRLLVTMKTSQIFIMNIEFDAKGISIRFDRLGQPFHIGAVLSMDVSVSKPILVTSGIDKSIRIWNYIENNVEIINYFPEPAQCVAIHPNGLYLLVGFNSTLKLMAILMDDIRPYWEHSVRGTRECKFSHGGQYFAIVSNINVLICDTWSFEIRGTLKVASTRIKELRWSEDDTKLLTICSDGSIQHWNLFTFKKDLDMTVDTQLLSASMSSSTNITYAVTKDRGIQEITKGVVTREFFAKEQFSHVHVSSTGQMMMLATKRGKLRALKYPFNPEEAIPEDDYVEYGFQSSPIVQLCMTFNDRFLFTASDDGCIWIFRVHDKDGKLTKKEKDWTFSDEILVTKSDLRESYRMMNELKQKVEEIKTESDLQLKNKDLFHNSKINDLTITYTAEINTLKELIQKIIVDRNEKNEKNLVEITEAKKRHAIEMEEMKNSFYQKLESEEQRFALLEARRAQLEAQWQEQMTTIQKNHLTRKDEITFFYKRKIDEKANQIQKLKKEFSQNKVKQESYLVEIEKDIEKECLEITFTFENKLKEEKSALAKIQTENQVMKQTYDALIHQVEEHKKEYMDSVSDNKKLQQNIRSLENDILSLTNEVKERDDTIIDKEKRIYDLRKKNQELEKFKFVLDYKIIELRKQIEPRELDIVKLANQIKDMKLEHSNYVTTHLQLDSTFQDLVMKNYASLMYKLSEQWKSKYVKSKIAAIRNDIKAIHAAQSQIAKLKSESIRVYHKYKNIQEAPPEAAPKDAIPKFTESELLLELEHSLKNKSKVKKEEPQPEVSEEVRYREKLEQTLHILNEEAERNFDTRRTTAFKLLEEEALLTNEINSLRKDLQDRRQRIVDLEEALRKGTSLTEFLREELHSKGLNKMVRKGMINLTIDIPGELMKKTNLPLPPILSK
ncbi:Cilia- and flagella-associated protein 57 [Boothiomyces sp. JEL0866]|nr:Cilia- and flagella-associated protein 57 [Boothiomyces sp. JEL0866]